MTAPRTAFASFPSWAAVLAHVAKGGAVWYHAPLDLHPARVGATTRGKAPTKVRVTPSGRDCDPFWADAGHVDRFRRRVDASTREGLIALLETRATIEVIATPEDMEIEGNASAIDEATDAKAATWIRDQLAAGNEWAWCFVRVVATYGDLQGYDTIGGCSYESEADFKRGGCYDDMVSSAIAMLAERILANATALDELVTNTGGV